LAKEKAPEVANASGAGGYLLLTQRKNLRTALEKKS